MQRYSKFTIYAIQKIKKTSFLHYLCISLNYKHKTTQNMKTNKHHKIINQCREQKPRLTWVDYLSIAIVLIIIAMQITISYFKPIASPTPAVETQSATIDSAKICGEYSGTIQAHQHVEIRARIDGYLQQTRFSSGDYVNKNDILFTIDPKSYKAHVEKAKAQLNKSKALELKAEHDLSRIKLLYQQKATSQLELDNAIAAHESAKAEVIMSEADLTQAKIALDYTTIRAPISGFIHESTTDIGTLVGPKGKSLLATISNIDTIKICLNVTELDYLRSIEPGTISTREISITLADSTTLSVIGTAIFSTPQLNPDSFLIHLQIPNPNHTLLPGQSVKVKLPLKTHLNP